jgi:hypothetical protein
VVEELKLLGHKMVFDGQSKKSHKNTTIYYRQEAKENCDQIKASIPELANADVVLDPQVATQYNSPVVIVLGQDFYTPNIYVIYGRVIQPALQFENFGDTAKSFS